MPGLTYLGLRVLSILALRSTTTEHGLSAWLLPSMPALNLAANLVVTPFATTQNLVSSLLGPFVDSTTTMPTELFAAQTLIIPSTVPASASPPIDPRYPGFAFEQSSFYNYSFDEDGNPNLFSQHLIGSVYNRTGGTPVLRVGGTSGDFGSYDSKQHEVANRPATEGPPAFHKPFLSLGTSYFEAFKNFPGADFIFMVPLARRNLGNSIEWARMGLEAIGDRLEALEIGNEPDLYHWFSVDDYVKEYEKFNEALTHEFPDQLGGVIFQALDTASSSSKPKEILNVDTCLEAGINSTKNIKQIGYHFYQRVDDPRDGLPHLQREVINHTAIVHEMSVFEPHIEYLRANAPGVPFLLSEVGNSLGKADLEARNILATALWNVDYQLHGLAMGVSRVNNQQIMYPGFQMWEPVSSKYGPPLVRPNFYSQPLIADFIGRATADNNVETRVTEIDIRSDLLSAYAAYDDGKLARIAIVNLELWISIYGSRPSVSLKLQGLGSGLTKATVAALTAPEGTYADTTLTYGGLQWTYESQGREVQVGSSPANVTIDDGVLHVSVEATSAVLITLS